MSFEITHTHSGYISAHTTLAFFTDSGTNLPHTRRLPAAVAGMDDLLDDAEQPAAGTSTAAAATEVKIRIVKCALRRALALPDAEYSQLSAVIEKYVVYISRSMRRASLALLRHLLAQVHAGQPVPDLFRQNTTFWKNWLRLGSGAAGEAVPANLGPAPAMPTDVVELDQVIAYAAVGFQTAVCNNAYVPLIPRLTRLIKAELRNRDDPDAPLWMTVITQLRSKQPQYTGWPAWLRAYIEGVRARLLVPEDKYVHDEWGKTLPFPDLFAFNVWMQRRFMALEARRIALSPVISVCRKHVRLDKRVLVKLFTQLYPDDPRVHVLRELQARHSAARRRGEPGFLHPDRLFIPAAPKPRKKDASTEDEWKKYLKARADHGTEVARIRSSPPYKHQLEANRLLVSAVMAVTRALFSKLPLPKSGNWAFDGSVVTDGVSVSLQYSSVRPKPPDVKKPKRAPPVERTDQYDVDLPTVISGVDAPLVVVIGVDPGRVNIAAVSYVLDEERNKLCRETAPRQGSWNLSRGEFLTRSGVRDMDLKKSERFSILHTRWSTLGADTAALRTTETADVDLYLDRLAGFDEEWWQLVLRRRESRDALRRYGGKRSVLDAFFSKVKRQLEKMFPGSVARVGYGSAALSMKPSGRGECAVPTTGAFLACKRAFGAGAVGVVDEHNTTKKEWATGDTKESVFAVFSEENGAVRRDLGHTTARAMPVVPEERREVVSSKLAQMAAAAARRRGARTDAPHYPVPVVHPPPQQRLRYPEVRGLRFSPERRMYLDRDREAARTIARLRTQELLGRARPSPFCRGHL